MLKFQINSKTAQFDGEPSTPLLWVIRDELNLTGTKFGCGIGQCGACTVHIDGQARRTCITPVSAVSGKHITTIEGLAPASDKLHPVQQAWLEMDVPQCGYCQPGQIMTAVDLLKRNPKPTDEDINQSMGNLCRCGTYVRMRKAIHRAVELAAEEV